LAQSELTNLITYFHNNNLVPNPTKTQYTIFYPTTTQGTLRLNINKIPIQQTEQAKLLGIIIERTMKHHKTITNIIKKLQGTIQNLRYANKLLPTKTMLNLYYQHAYPHLIGNITIWGTSDPNKTYIQPLIRIQKKIIRLIKNLPPRTHTKPLMTELKLLNLTNLYIHRTCVDTHPYIHQTDQRNRPEHNNNYIKIAQIHDHQTRHSLQGHHYIPNHQKHARHNNLKHKMEQSTKEKTQIWNTLPQQLRHERSLQKFKTNLKEYLLALQS
jgi:hypothetical protein